MLTILPARLRAGALVSFALSLAPAAALAGIPAPGPTDPAVVAIAKGEATAAFKARRFADARAAGERAYAAGGGADALETIAVSALQLGQAPLAYACYETIVADPAAPAAIAGRARNQLAALQAQTVEVTIETTGGEAEIVADTVSMGHTPLAKPLRFLPGRHELTARFAGAEPQQRTLQVVLGKPQTAVFGAPAAATPVVAAAIVAPVVAPMGPAPVPKAPDVASATPPSATTPAGRLRLARLAQNRVELDEVFHFDTSDASVLPPSRALLDDVAATLVEHPEVRRLRIEGHTDARGEAEDNLWLSRARAFSVMRGLVERGIARERLEAAGYGESRPLVAESSADAEGRNRRVELAVVELGPPPPSPVVPPEPGPAPAIFVPPVKPPPHRAPNVPVGVQHLSDGVTPGLEAGLTSDDLRRVAVLPFDALDDESKRLDLGRMTAELVGARLKARPWILQVERNRLDEVVGELKRGERGEVAPATAAKAGHLLGADTVLIGSLAAVGPDFLVTTRAVDTESGQVIAAFDQAIERAGMVAFSEDAVEVRTPIGSAWRAAAAPGWGQFYNDEPVKGVAIASTFGAAAVATGVSWYLGEQARDDYFASGTRAQDTVGRRDEGNTHIERARWAALSMGIVWAVGVADAYLNGKDARTLRPGAMDDGVQASGEP